MARVIEVTSKSWQEEIMNAQNPVVVDFWAQWCGPCRIVAPILEKLAKELEGKVKITKLNVDKEAEIADKYHIQSIPTLIVFKGGKKVARITGAQTIESYKRLIEKIL